MNLLDAPNRTALEIISISQEKLSEDALRFGIEAGEVVKIIAKQPGGAIVIQKNEQQIAIGSELAKTIQVKLL